MNLNYGGQRNMTIDERLERLAERHEALTQSVEMLTTDVRALTSDMNQMRTFMDEVLLATARLLSIAQEHERRNESRRVGWLKSPDNTYPQ
jgi:archaellum component FlaC